MFDIELYAIPEVSRSLECQLLARSVPICSSALGLSTKAEFPVKGQMLLNRGT